jgi:hypothetical protein
VQRHINYPRWQPLLSKGLAKLFITAAEGWSGMYRMRRLLSRSEWLLVDEPEEPDLFLAALFLFMSCFALALPLLDLYEGESVLDDLVPPALVPMFFAWVALYVLPTHRGRTILWLQVTHALSLVGASPCSFIVSPSRQGRSGSRWCSRR